MPRRRLKTAGGRGWTLPRSGTPFIAKDHGARGYSYVLTSDDMAVTACSGKDRAAGRAALGLSAFDDPGPAVARVVEILTKDFFVREPELLVSRVDLYADLQGGDLGPGDMRWFITTATFRKEPLRVGRAPGPAAQRLPVREVGAGGACL